MPVTQRAYGKLESGEEVTAYLLTNGNNVSVELISLGAVRYATQCCTATQWRPNDLQGGTAAPHILCVVFPAVHLFHPHP